MNIIYKENALTEDVYNRLRCSVGWPVLPNNQVKIALGNGLYSVVAENNGSAVGMGRLVGDGAIYWYIQDMAIKPAYQGNGIGRSIVNMLMDYIQKHRIPDAQVTVGLMAAKGKDKFYVKHGFIVRPNETFGPGMITYITDNKEN